MALFKKKRSSGRRWTEAEIRKLCNMWPDYSVRAIKEAFPGRSWEAILHVALRLKLGPRYQGFVSLQCAEKKIGYDAEWIRLRIKEGEILGHRVGIGTQYPRFVVDLEDLEEYVKRYTKLETFRSAGKRHGISGFHLARIYKALGKSSAEGRTRPHLVPSEVDQVVSTWKDQTTKRKLARAASKKAHPTKGTVHPVGSIVSQALSQMEPGNEHSLSCSDSESTIGQAA